jgi:hypothetical protein
MNQVAPQNTSRIIRDAFFDLTLSLEAVFLLHGVKGILAEDIIGCMEEEYDKTLRKLSAVKKQKKASWKPVADKFISRLEKETI